MSTLLTETEFEYRPPRPPRRFRITPLILTGLVLVAGAWLSVRLGESVGERLASDEAPPEPGTAVLVVIDRGSSTRTIGELLVEEGVIDSAVAFSSEVRARDAESDLKAGTYELETGMTVNAVIAALVKGPDPTDTYDITIREGLRIDEMLTALSRQTGYSVEELSKPLLDGSVTSELLQVAEPDSIRQWEGLLFPATYELFAEAEPDEILQKLASEMERRVAAVDWSRLDELGLSNRYEALIVASLIEAEAKLDGDRPLIASVIYNRLGVGQGLFIDATVLYAKALAGDESRSITQSDLEIDSPYNTYKWAGLPPTPIGAPRMASMEAAADPPETDYFYYLVTDPATGQHSFCPDLECHNTLKAQVNSS